MAHIVPSNIDELRLGGASEAELDTLEYLKSALSQDYTVFYSLRVAKQRGKQDLREIDFVVMNASGDVLLIEQKNGNLIEQANQLLVHYYNEAEPKSVVDQVHKAREVFLAALKNARLPKINISVLVYCPDHRVESVSAAGMAVEMIVDAKDRDKLGERIDELLGPGLARDDTPKQIKAFLNQSLDLAPDLMRTVDQQEAVFQRLSSGLHDLPLALEFSPWRLHVQAAAGSGKSVLAMEIYRRAIAQGERVLVACYNRPLADLLQHSLDNAVDVNNFHGHCVRWAQQYGDPALAKESLMPHGEFWDKLVDNMADVADKAGPYDWLIVDEGQDFHPDWFEVLRLAMKEDFKCLWLEDREQCLIPKPCAVPQGFVKYTCRDNFRTPQKIAQFIDKTLGKDIIWRNPLPGLAPVVSPYESEAEQVDLLAERITALKTAGFRPDQIAIVSLRGQSSAIFRDLDKIAGHRIRKFSGDHDEQQQAIYTDGEIGAETIHRFKGQQAPAIVLTDVEMLTKKDRTESEEAVLWCGLTRALVACEILAQK